MQSVDEDLALKKQLGIANIQSEQRNPIQCSAEAYIPIYFLSAAVELYLLHVWYGNGRTRWGGGWNSYIAI